MTKQIIRIKIYLSFIAAVLFTFPFAQAQSVLVSPTTQTLRVGDTVSVKIMVENLSGLKVYSIKVSYDKNLLRCIGAAKLDFLSGPFSTFFFPLVDSLNGTVQCDEAILGTGSSTGSGGLFEIRFTGKNTGVSPINLISLDLRNIDNQQLTYSHTNGSVTVQDPTGIESQSQIGNSLILKQNFPNPFGGAAHSGTMFTNLEFTIPDETNVILEVFNITGERVSVLIDKKLTRGSYSVKFSAGDLPGGIYICKLSAGKYSRAIKMNLLN